jgi:ATP-binding cassette, subfamily C (CFTR/MRP), member 1
MIPTLQQPILLQTTFSSSSGYLHLSPGSHSFCHNEEGWGPTSPYRWDFTPCFLDVWQAIVAAFGVVFGAGAIWYLLKKCPPQPVGKNWHFYAKLVYLTLTLYPKLFKLTRSRLS